MTLYDTLYWERYNTRTRPKAPPCDGCNRRHRGPRCKPEDARSVRVGFTLPFHVRQALLDHIPWGERSAYIASLIEADLLD